LSWFVPEGYPDMTIFLKNRVLFLEIKSAKGQLKNKQKLMGITLMHLGFEWYPVRSFKRFIEVLYGRTN